MSDRPVRVRVAPSPTGDPHVGTAYQALFNYTFARSRAGKLILRIEDTDRARSTPESEAAILESLSWLGIEWDEGPDVGGPHAPYRQSERVVIYRQHARQLLDAGSAYRSFISKQALDQLRADQREQGWQGFFDAEGREMSREQSDRRADSGEPFVIRLKTPLDGDCVMKDLLRGEVSKEWAQIDDQILIKSDGYPTYHLANVVDDHLMGISHVIRGEEWISSLPKHLLLYEAFGWQPPVFCHLPLLRNPDKSKLSKRKNPVSIGYYQRAGYLPQALLNFLGLLGWSMPSGEEKFTIDEMIAEFRLEDVSLGGPVFDLRKLRWLNGRYIREDHDARSLRLALENWALNATRLESILPLAQPRMDALSDWGYLTAFFLADEEPFDPTDLKLKGKTADELAALLQTVIWRLEQQRDFTPEALQQTFRELSDSLEIKLRDLTLPLYVALTGKTASTPLFQSMAILGSDIVRMRIARAVDALGGLSSKKLRELEKQYEARFGTRG
ncbi:MAG: glutamate--tRNA ligase [Acidobacteriota bacterium]|nr:MAG: glutamate--tRNA ligase [Acidobacteriota bacterium]